MTDSKNNSTDASTLEWWKASAFGLGFVIFAIGAAVLYQSGTIHAYLKPSPSPTTTSRLISCEPDIYDRAQVQCLGSHIAREYPGSKILLITNPETEHSKPLTGFKRMNLEIGLASKAVVAASESPKPSAADSKNANDEIALMYEYFLSAEAFDQMVDAHPECDVVISLIGLPYDFPEMKHWREPDKTRKKLFLVHANLLDLQKAISKGFVQGAVAYHPDAKFLPRSSYPTNINVAFTHRYLLVTPATIEQTAKKYPKMFKAPTTENEVQKP